MVILKYFSLRYFTIFVKILRSFDFLEFEMGPRKVLSDADIEKFMQSWDNDFKILGISEDEDDNFHENCCLSFPMEKIYHSM